MSNQRFRSCFALFVWLPLWGMPLANAHTDGDRGRSPLSQRERTRSGPQSTQPIRPRLPPGISGGAFPLLANLRETLPELFLDAVNNLIQGEIRPGRIWYEAPATLHLRDVEIRDPEGARVASVEYAALDVAVTQLLLGEIRIQRLNLEKPRVYLKLEGDVLNVVRTFSPKSQSNEKSDSDLTILINDISVSQGHFEYHDPQVVDVAVENISGRADITVETSNPAVSVVLSELKSDVGLVRLPDLDIPLKDVQIRSGTLEKNVLSLRGMTGKALDALVSGEGTFGVNTAGRYNLRANVQAPANIWPPRLAELSFSLPAFDSVVELTGPLKSPTIKAFGTFGPLSPYKARVQEGAFEIQVTQNSVQFSQVNARLVEGDISAEGLYDIQEKSLYLRARLNDVALSDVMTIAQVETESSGFLDGHVVVNGNFAQESQVSIEADFQARAARAFGVKTPGPAQIAGQVTWTEDNTRLKNVRIVGTGFQARVDGTVDTASRRLDLTLNGKVARPDGWWPDAPEKMRLENAKVDGQIAGPLDDVHVAIDVHIDRANLWGVPLENTQSALWIDARRLEARELQGRLANGIVAGTIGIGFGKTNTLAGQLTLERALLQHYRLSSGDAMPIQGLLHASAELDGTLEKPVVQLALVGRQVTYEEESLGEVRADLTVFGEELVARQVGWQLDGLDLTNKSAIGLRYDDLGLFGDLEFRITDKSAVSRRWEWPVEGTAWGTIRLGGSVDHPDIKAVGQLQNIITGHELLGDGPFFVHVTDALDQKIPSTWVQLSGELSSPVGKLQLRSTYAVEPRNLHAVLDVHEVPVERWTTRFENLTPIEGNLYGRITATGSIDHVDAQVNLRVTDARLPLGSMLTESVPKRGALYLESTVGPPAYRPLGDIRVSATLEDGALAGYACTLSWNADAAAPPCEKADAVLRLTGTLDQKTQHYDIALDTQIREDRLQDWSPVLRSEQAKASVAVSGHARLQGLDFEQAPQLEGRLRLLSAHFEHPDMLPAKLSRVTEIRFREDEFTLQNPVDIEVGSADVRAGGLRISGRANQNDVDVLVEGNIELAFLKILTHDISNATGRVQANLWLQGSPRSPRIAGVLAPENGASMTLRSLQERFEFNGGSLEVEPLATEGSEHRIRASELRILLGGGLTELSGFVELDAAPLFANGQFAPLRYAVEAIGNGMTIGHRNIWGESSFQLRFDSNRKSTAARKMNAEDATAEEETNETILSAGDEPLPFRGSLSGRVELSDGLLRERFEMTNFVLEARPDKPSEPLAKQILRITQLHEIDLDVDLVVQSFQVRADLVSFLATTQLSGGLRLENTLTIPNLVGAIEVVDGSVRFPKANLEFTEARVEFPRERVGLNPRVYVAARGDLAPQPPNCAAEIPVLLTLEGEDLNQVQMNLEAEESDLRHTRTELLSAVLLGQALPRCSDGAGEVDPDLALRAVVSGLTSTLRKGIERFVADKTGSDLQVDLVVKDGRVGTDLRWKLSKRLQLEGGTGFGYRDDGNADSATLGSSAFARFLILDHFPVNGDLFVEGGFSSADSSFVNDDTAVELKLTYRIFGY